MKRTRNPHQRAELAYAYLLNAAQTRVCFSPEDLAKSTGYKLSTAKIYLSKKWYWFTTRLEDGRYTVQDFGGYSFLDFKKDLSQKTTRSYHEQNSRHTILTRLTRQQMIILVCCLVVWGIALALLRKQRWWFMPL